MDSEIERKKDREQKQRVNKKKKREEKKEMRKGIGQRKMEK